MNNSIHVHSNTKKEFIPLGQHSHNELKKISVARAEIVKINDRIITYPCDQVQINKQDFNKVQVCETTNDPRKPNQNDQLIQIYKLHSPIIINLRDDALPGNRDTRELLTKEELDYLRKNNSIATLFIHGFNIAYGEYSPQIIALNDAQNYRFNHQADLDNKREIFKFSSSESTILKTQRMIEREINQNQGLKFKLSDEDLNGTGAHNWFVHMEHNINMAANRIKEQNYSHYIRLIHIAWSGDVLPIAYLEAEELADKAGKRLVNLLKQLMDEKIDIYIIAHSLGNRLLLNAMEILGQNGHENCLKQVFLWQAAVPNTSLSNNTHHDLSIKFNSHFPNAHLSSNKITVLYSQNDSVLRLQYWLANRIGFTPKELLSDPNSLKLLYRFFDQDPIELASFLKLAEGDLNFKNSLKSSEHNIDLILRAATELYRLPKISLAMGYRGVDLNNSLMQRLINCGKLVQVNQIYLSAHSAMKIPSEEMMNLSYKRWIVNKIRGIPY